MTEPSESAGLTGFGKAAVALFVLACLAAAYYFMFVRQATPAPTAGSPAAAGGPISAPAAGKTVEIGIAFGTEKQRWFEWAAGEFDKSGEGRTIQVNLLPMGSIDAARALLAGDQRIHVWSPASAAYRDVFVQDWQLKYGGAAIVKEEPLALTPMVFVMWEERYEAFARKYKAATLSSLSAALQEKGGWDSIAGRPEWGLFKFGHAHPNQSNSGLMAIVLAAYDYHKKTRDLTLKDILDVGFQQWLERFERGVSGLSNSTATQMREMVLKGPSSYDALLVYESVAIDFLRNAEGRWGRLRLAYPEYNAWNENPYYIINGAWSSKAQRKAAETFLAFLLSESIQKEALAHGFRPGNPAVPVKFAGSPFVDLASYGVLVDLAKVCEPPRADVVTNLLASWQRAQGSR